MAESAVPSLFLSHAHQDKLMARCVVRYCVPYGVGIWLDERELRLGINLDTTIRQHIEEAGAVLVLASLAASSSAWVERELEFARESGKSITPIFVDDLQTHALFRNFLGLDAVHPARFADAIHELLKSFLASFGREVPPPDHERLRAELERLVEEEPDLAPLVRACLEQPELGLHQDNIETVRRAPFHSLDFAVNALHELLGTELSARHAAHCFRWAGAGRRALAAWIRTSGDGGLPLVIAVGDTLEPTFLDAAIELLRLCDPPANHALYSFIAKNAMALSPKQVSAVVRLTTWPVRTPDRLGDVLGWIAWRDLPPTPELPRLWSRWIESGAFDNAGPRLAQYLKDAAAAELRGVEDVTQSLGRHVRSLARSGDATKVWTALNYLRSVADADAPCLGIVSSEIAAARGTYEWEQWEKRNREEAEEMACHLDAHIAAARTDQEWLGALEAAKRNLANRRALDRAIANDRS